MFTLRLRKRKKWGNYTTGIVNAYNEKEKALFIGREILKIGKTIMDQEQAHKLDLDTLRFIVKMFPVKVENKETGAVVPKVNIIVGYKVDSYEKELAGSTARKKRKEARKQSNP